MQRLAWPLRTSSLAGSSYRKTVTDKIRRTLEWRRVNPFGALRQVGKLPLGNLLLWVFFIHQVAFYAYPSTWAYFTIERFDWTPRQVGFSLAMFGITLAFTQGFIIRIIIPKLGEWRVLLLGLGVSISADFLFAFANQGWMVYAIIVFMALSFTVTPSLQAIISKATPDDAQGELQGVLTSVGAVATIIAPLAMTFVFGYFISTAAPVYFPGAPFLLAGILDAIGFILIILIWRRKDAI